MQLLVNTIMFEKTRWAAEKRPDPDLLDLVPMIAGQTGYREVEVWQYHVSEKSLREVERIRSAGDKLGLRFSVVGAYPKINRRGDERAAEFERLKHVVDCAHVLGAEVVKFFAGGANSKEAKEEDWSAATGFLREVLDWAAKRGMVMTAEAHGGTFGDCVEGMRELLRRTGHPALKVCFQPYSFDSLPQTLTDFDALLPETIHLHLQSRKGNQTSLLAEGDMDYRAYLSHVRRSGFDGFLCVEFTKDIIQEGTFDIGKVLRNSEEDRRFVEEVWNAAAVQPGKLR